MLTRVPPGLCLWIVAVFVLGLLFSGCGKQGTVEDRIPVSLSSFSDGKWELVIDRSWDRKISEITFPTGQLTEANYQPASNGHTYSITVSDGTTRISIDGGAVVTGQRKSLQDGSIVFELTEGLFAGGRFVVWSDMKSLQAELTIYGSGLPVVASERGILVLKP